MPYYEEDLVEEVRSRNDILDVISGYVRLQKKGSTYFGLCPFHNEKSPSFSVSQGKQMYHCFGCGAGGNVFTFLMEYENFSFVEAMQSLAERSGIDLPKQEMTSQMRQEADLRQKLLEVNKEAGKYFYSMLRSQNGANALEYFKERGLSDEIMRKFGLGYSDRYSNDLYQYLRKKGYEDELLKQSGLVSIDEVRGGHDKFWNRAMFPIMEVHHKIIGFGGRVMGEGEPKYLNSPETKIFDKGRNLYGLNFARQSRKTQILLCEGYMDVIALHQAGFDNAVASLGTAFTSGHASLLKRYTKEVYLVFDSDSAGIRAALRAIPILKEVELHCRVIDLKPYKDPDEFIKAMGAKAFEERIAQAKNSFLFEIEILQQEYDLNDPEGKTSFYNETAKKLLQFTEELERNNYIEAVAREFVISYENLRNLVVYFGTKTGLVNDRARPQSTFSEKKKEDGMKQSQKLMLTWLVEDTTLFDTTSSYISPSDFTEEIYEKVAEILFLQYKETKTVNPAKIISMFSDETEQREIASIFNARILNLESEHDLQKALWETILRIKRNSIQYRSKNLRPDDIAGLQSLMTDKKQLEQMEKQQLI
ncbi:MAG: DNA primase [Lachnospiraceae bacterium]